MSNVEKRELITDNNLEMRRELNKGEKLHSELEQIHFELLSLKHRYVELSNFIRFIIEHNDLQANTELIGNKMDQLAETLPHIKSIKSILGKELLSTIRFKPAQVQSDNDFEAISTHEIMTSLYEAEIDSKISSYKLEIKEIKEKISRISQELYKRERSPDLLEKLPAFIELIQTKYNGIISEQEVTMLESLNFTEFSLQFSAEIASTKQQIEDIKSAIMESRDRYIHIDASIKNLGDTQVELSRLENEHESMNEQILQLQRYNDNLELHMDEIVNKQVFDKMDRIIAENGEEASKFLLAGEYILEKFGAILDKDELDELFSEINKRMLSVQQKLLPSL